MGSFYSFVFAVYVHDRLYIPILMTFTVTPIAIPKISTDVGTIVIMIVTTVMRGPSMPVGAET